MATRLNVVNPPLREARNDLIYPPRADFRGDFTSSIIPQQSMGVISFTRATTATVTDNEGVIRNCLSGEARFKGARRVENMTGYSETFSNAAWTKITSTITPNAIAGPTGLGRASSLIEGAGTTQHGISTGTSTTNIQGNTYISSWYAKAGTRQFMQLLTSGAVSIQYANFDLINGTFSESSAGVGAMVSVGNGWYRCSIKYTSTSTNIALVYCMIATSLADVRYLGYTGDGVSNIYIHAHQHENVTGQSIQTPSEYVSTNVLSSPFHGANVDGVKYFKTDKSGNPISPDTLKGFLCEGARTNLFLQSEDFSSVSWWKNDGSVVADFALSPSGYTNADKFVPSAGTTQSYLTQSVTVTASIYTISFYLKSAGKQFVQMDASGSISNGYVNFDIVNGVVGGSNLWSGYIEAVTGFPGMYRCSITTETVTAGTGYFSLFVVDSNSAARGSTSVNNGTDSIIVWGAQFEQGQNASSYIPTTTTTVTRNIDSLIMNTKNAIDTYGACSFIATIEDNSQFDRRIMSFTSHTMNRLQFQVKRAGLTGANLLYGDGAVVQSVTPGRDVGANNVVFAWTNLSNVSLYLDNTKYNSGVAPNLVFTTVDIGSASGIYAGFGCIKNVRIWKTRPTDAELLALSNSSY